MCEKKGNKKGNDVHQGEPPRINLDTGKINVHNEGLPIEIHAGGFSEYLGETLNKISSGKSIKAHRVG